MSVQLPCSLRSLRTEIVRSPCGDRLSHGAHVRVVQCHLRHVYGLRFYDFFKFVKLLAKPNRRGRGPRESVRKSHSRRLPPQGGFAEAARKGGYGLRTPIGSQMWTRHYFAQRNRTRTSLARARPLRYPSRKPMWTNVCEAFYFRGGSQEFEKGGGAKSYCFFRTAAILETRASPKNLAGWRGHSIKFLTFYWQRHLRRGGGVHQTYWFNVVLHWSTVEQKLPSSQTNVWSLVLPFLSKGPFIARNLTYASLARVRSSPDAARASRIVTYASLAPATLFFSHRMFARAPSTLCPAPLWARDNQQRKGDTQRYIRKSK